ncbi:MAG: hypothetical protein IJP93_03385 [Bacteroidales bacterium]|nr:hypothetical protein [Bacteroidales bacterium]MBR0290728.1 hypothetical protein [Bacteroidales bacterium]
MEKMPMTEPERLDFLIKTLESGVAARFAEKTGMPLPKVSRIRSGELRLNKQFDAIIRAYPLVNREWLETGVGYPGDLTVDLVKERLTKVVEDRDRVIRALTKELELQQRIIEEKLG